MYFGINLLFAVRLRRVLAKNDVKTKFGRTLLAQYAGMLTSDVTPGRSGYILTPVYLRDQDVPTSKSLSSVLGIQTFEFLIKVIGGVGAVVFLVTTVPSQTWNSVFHARNFGSKHRIANFDTWHMFDDGWSTFTCSFHMVPAELSQYLTKSQIHDI